MGRGFLPKTDGELLAWSANFASRIVDSGGRYGIDSQQADAFVAARQSFADAMNAANDPATRTGLAVRRKDESADALRVITRQLSAIAQAYPATTDEDRFALGLSVRGGRTTRVDVPTSSPRIDVTPMPGRRVTLQLSDDAATGRRGRPVGVVGAAVWHVVADEPPASLADWRFVGNTSRTTLSVTYDASVPVGATVWFIAHWMNPTLEAGELSRPAGATLMGGSVVALNATMRAPGMLRAA